jgi:hypothetical protein
VGILRGNRDNRSPKGMPLKRLTPLLAVFLCLALPGLGLAATDGCCRDLAAASAAVGPMEDTASPVSRAGGHEGHDMAPETQTAAAESADSGQGQPLAENCGLLSCLKLPTASVAAARAGLPLPSPVVAAVSEPAGFVLAELPKSIFRPPRLLSL